MCGRFSLDRKENIISARFKVKLNLEQSVLPLYNIAPSQPAACIVEDELILANWGLGGKGVDGKSRSLINARAETVLEKYPFKNLLKNRCLVIASGYIEWKTIGKIKIPHLHTLKSGDLFAMAGIFESDPETGKRRFTILTKSAGIQASALHDRMPAILTQNLEKEWISGGIPDEEFMQKICGAEEPELNIFSISPKINSSFENEATLLQPVSYSVAEQLSLF